MILRFLSALGLSALGGLFVSTALFFGPAAASSSVHLSLVMAAAATPPLKVRVALSSVCKQRVPRVLDGFRARSSHVGPVRIRARDNAAVVSSSFCWLWIRPGSGRRACGKAPVAGICCARLRSTHQRLCPRRRWTCSSRETTRRHGAEKVETQRQIPQPGAYRATTLTRGPRAIQSLQQALRS